MPLLWLVVAAFLLEPHSQTFVLWVFTKGDDLEVLVLPYQKAAPGNDIRPCRSHRPDADSSQQAPSAATKVLADIARSARCISNEVHLHLVPQAGHALGVLVAAASVT